MDRDLPQTPVHRKTSKRRLRSVAAAIAAVVVSVSFALPVQADELDDRKEQLKREIAAQSNAVQDAHVERDAAVDAANAARTELTKAELRLAEAESALQESQELDELRARELAAAEDTLRIAKEELAAAVADVERVDSRINEEVMVTTQNSSGLLNLALLFSDVDTNNLSQRLQLAETLLDSSAQELDEMEELRLKAEDARTKADAAQKAADKARQAAADQLAASEEAQAEAANLKAEVANLVVQRDKAEAAAQSQVSREEQRQAELEAENSSVEKRIQARIAAERAAAAKAAAEQKARDQAAAAKAAQAKADRAAAAAEKARSGSGNSRSSSSSRTSAESSSTQSSGSTSFSYPVSARITSQYGMRLHPVLGYWKLHDGTDFGASCGTPIKAPANGVVTERYFNAGYGNRLMIDHGLVNGSYVTTGYNHASSYIVGVGQRVVKGQTIGYVGTTGYSTGCHLHLMTWQNGSVVNPMARWFG